MSNGDKAIILAQVENKSRGKRQALMALGIPKSSYYRWRRCDGLESHSGDRGRPWNRLLSISEMGHFLNRTLWHDQAALTSSLGP